MSGSYFNGMCLDEMAAMYPNRVWATGVRKTITVLNEAGLLGLTAGEINVGDDVIILAATPYTLLNGVVKVVDTTNVGTWSAFVVIGNSSDLISVAYTQTTDPLVAGMLWNNGGVLTFSDG